MDILPSFVRFAILSHLHALLLWLSEVVYSQVLRGDEFLLQVAGLLDWAPLEAACADYHHASGPGAKPTHTTPHLLRAILAKYLLDLSLRQLEDDIRYNIVVKRFCGYHLFESGPDHATLERFEQWLHLHHQRTLFDDVLRQIDAAFPKDRQRPQIGDTFALRANAAPQSVIALLRQSCQYLLRSLAQLDLHAQAEVLRQLDPQQHEALFGAQHEAPEHRLDPEHRRRRLQATVLASQELLRLLPLHLPPPPINPQPERQQVEQWLLRIDKILHDEVLIRTNPDGSPFVAELPKNKKGAYRIASAVDPDATFRVHGKDDEKTDYGYNVNLAVTSEFVREIQADTGAQPDAVAIPDLLLAQKQHHDLLPDKFIYDQAAGAGKHFAEVERVTGGQTQLVARPVNYSQRSERFAPDAFSLSPDGFTLTCPAGQSSATAYRSGSGEGRTFRFSPQLCADCPLAAACRGDLSPDKMRQVFISDHRSAFEDARAYAKTDAFKEDMKLRPLVERFIANLVRYHGARHARARGKQRADFQAKLVLSAAKECAPSPSTSLSGRASPPPPLPPPNQGLIAPSGRTKTNRNSKDPTKTPLFRSKTRSIPSQRPSHPPPLLFPNPQLTITWQRRLYTPAAAATRAEFCNTLPVGIRVGEATCVASKNFDRGGFNPSVGIRVGEASLHHRWRVSLRLFQSLGRDSGR